MKKSERLWQTHGLEHLQGSDLRYSPDGNNMIIVPNGWLGELFYDAKAGKLYSLGIAEVELTPAFKEICEGESAKKRVRQKMNYVQAKEWLAEKGLGVIDG